MKMNPLPDWFLFFPIIVSIINLFIGGLELPKVVKKFQDSKTSWGKFGRAFEFLFYLLLLSLFVLLYWLGVNMWFWTLGDKG